MVTYLWIWNKIESFFFFSLNWIIRMRYIKISFGKVILFAGNICIHSRLLWNIWVHNHFNGNWKLACQSNHIVFHVFYNRPTLSTVQLFFCFLKIVEMIQLHLTFLFLSSFLHVNRLRFLLSFTSEIYSVIIKRKCVVNMFEKYIMSWYFFFFFLLNGISYIYSKQFDLFIIVLRIKWGYVTHMSIKWCRKDIWVL